MAERAAVPGSGSPLGRLVPAEQTIRSVPGWDTTERVGGVIGLTIATLRELVRPPFSWRRDFVEECWQALVRCTLPLILSTFALGFGTLGIDAGGLVQVLGGSDRLGTISALAGLRAFAPFVSGVVVAGVVGTAVCADLGARKIRDELDAMAVLGVNPIAKLVAPRFLAIFCMTILLSLVGAASVEASGYFVATVLLDQPGQAFLATFPSQLSIIELPASLIKAAGYGILIAAVFCYEGLNVAGGTEGVGRAVNRSVVISFAGIFIFLFMFDAVYQAAFPSLQQIR